MHHDDTAPTSPKPSSASKRTAQAAISTRASQKTAKAPQSPKTAKKSPGVAKRGSGKGAKKPPTPKKYKRKPPHLIVKDAQTARVRRSVVKEEELDEGQVPRGQTILLGEMAEFINAHFSLKEGLNEFTPYDWWRRHKIGTLSTPLPKPVRMIGTGPLFLAADIVKWYKNYVANKGRWGTGA